MAFQQVVTSHAPAPCAAPAAVSPSPPATSLPPQPFFADQAYSVRQFLAQREVQGRHPKRLREEDSIASKFTLCWPSSLRDEHLKMLLRRDRGES